MLKLIPTAAVFLLVSCVCNCLDDGDADLAEATMATTEATLMDSLRGFIANAIDGGSSGMARQLLNAEISSSCSLGLLKLMRGLRSLEPWAVRREYQMLFLSLAFFLSRDVDSTPGQLKKCVA